MPSRTIVRILFPLAFLAAADCAYAAAQRTFVASYGLSANTVFNCSLAKPCRAFSEAMGVTASNGEVIVLDSAGYGPVTIVQSVSIVAPPGIYAGVTVSVGTGITVDGPSIFVTLKGLTVNGQGGADGIAFVQGARLILERCTVTTMTNNGINVTASGGFTAMDGVVAIGNGVNGVVISGDTGASIVRSRAEGNAISGFLVADGATVAIRDSEASRNVLAGLRAETNVAVTTTVSIDGFAATAGQDGIDVAAPGIGAKTIVDATRANLSGNSVAGLEMYGPSAFGQNIVTVTDSLLAGNGFLGVTMTAPPTPVWKLTLGGNRIVNTSGTGIRNTNGNGIILTRGDNTMSGNAPDLSATLTTLNGI